MIDSLSDYDKIVVNYALVTEDPDTVISTAQLSYLFGFWGNGPDYFHSLESYLYKYRPVISANPRWVH